jgi:hypothetical protein
VKNAVALLYSQFHFPGLQLLTVKCSLKILNSRNKQLVGFKLLVVLSIGGNVALHPALDANYPFVACTLHAHYSFHKFLGYRIHCCGLAKLVFK